MSGNIKWNLDKYNVVLLEILEDHKGISIFGNGVITMPQGDKTGPRGEGPRTGRGRGSC